MAKDRKALLDEMEGEMPAVDSEEEDFDFGDNGRVQNAWTGANGR